MHILGQSLQHLKNDLSHSSANHPVNTIIKTGFESIDSYIFGYRRGEMTVVAGRPGMGVTSFLIETALNMSTQHGYAGAFISVDISYAVLQAKFASIVMNMDINNIFNADASKINWPVDYSTLPLYLHTQGNRFLEDIIEQVEILTEKRSLDFLIIDSLQNVELQKPFFPPHLYFEKFNVIIPSLLDFARKKNIALICGSSIKRSVEYRGGSNKPYLSDIAQTSLIEERAEKVIILYRPEYYEYFKDDNGNSTKGIMQVSVEKNISGQCCEFKFLAKSYKNHPFRIIDPGTEANAIRHYLMLDENDDE